MQFRRDPPPDCAKDARCDVHGKGQRMLQCSAWLGGPRTACQIEVGEVAEAALLLREKPRATDR